MDDSPLPDPFAFDPVPSKTNRRDGWTPERQRIFIAALRLIGVVSYAAEAAGLTRKSAYDLLARAGPGSSFARAWEEAEAAGGTNVTFAAIKRAIDGVEEPYFFGGLQRGTRRVYDNRLLIAAFRRIQRMQAHD
jgi:hypothetical protein